MVAGYLRGWTLHLKATKDRGIYIIIYKSVLRNLSFLIIVLASEKDEVLKLM